MVIFSKTQIVVQECVRDSCYLGRWQFHLLDINYSLLFLLKTDMQRTKRKSTQRLIKIIITNWHQHSAETQQ